MERWMGCSTEREHRQRAMRSSVLFSSSQPTQRACRPAVVRTHCSILSLTLFHSSRSARALCFKARQINGGSSVCSARSRSVARPAHRVSFRVASGAVATLTPSLFLLSTPASALTHAG